MAKKKITNRKNQKIRPSKAINPQLKETTKTNPVQKEKVVTSQKLKQANDQTPQTDKLNLDKNSEPRTYESDSIQKTPSIWDNLDFRRRVVAVVSGLVAISVFAGFSFYVIPQRILTETDDQKLARETREREEKNERERVERESRLEVESNFLKFSENKTWDLVMTFKDFGDLKLNLKEEFAPKTVENFVRLTYRDYYDNTSIHRIVKRPDFSVIQGGDRENRNGSGGQSAFYVDSKNPGSIPDELWTVKPEFKVEGENNVLTNEPKLRYPDLYANFNPDSGTIEYRKGLILMAKTSEPNSAGSQFFVTLDKTILPAEYTVFGVISEDSLPVLDKIRTEVEPVQNSEETGESIVTQDGIPSKDLIIEKVEIISPNIS